MTRFDIIGYNLEHGPSNRPDEQADPVGSVIKMRELADQYGKELALGPDRSFAISDGAEMAPYVDMFILQVQRVQTEPETVRNFVEPLAEQYRAANPDVKISVQIRTEGDVVQLRELMNSMGDTLDGISILTSPETVDVATALMDELRPLPYAEFMAANGTVSSDDNASESVAGGGTDNTETNADAPAPSASAALGDKNSGSEADSADESNAAAVSQSSSTNNSAQSNSQAPSQVTPSASPIYDEPRAYDQSWFSGRKSLDDWRSRKRVAHRICRLCLSESAPKITARTSSDPGKL